MKTSVFNTQLMVIPIIEKRISLFSGKNILLQLLLPFLLSITFITVKGQDPSDIALTDDAEELFDKLNELVENRFNGGNALATGITDIERILQCPSTEVYAYDLEDDETVSTSSNACYASSSKGFANLCSFFGLDSKSYTTICVCWKITHLLEASHIHKKECEETGKKECLGEYIRFIDYVEVSALAVKGGSLNAFADPAKMKAAGLKGKVLDLLGSKLVIDGSSEESAISSSNSVVITKLKCTEGCQHGDKVTDGGVTYDIGNKSTKTVVVGKESVEVPLDKRDVRRKIVKQVSDLIKLNALKIDLLGWIYSYSNLKYIFPLNYNSGLGIGAGYYWDVFIGPAVNFTYQYRVPIRPFTLTVEPGIGFYSLKSEVTYSGHIMDSIHGGFYPMSYTKDKTITAIPLFLEAGLEKKFGRQQHWGLEVGAGVRGFLSKNLPGNENDLNQNVFKATIKDGDEYKEVNNCWKNTFKGPGSPVYFRISVNYFF